MQTLAEFAPLVPVPDANAHKYSRGKAVVVGGSDAYPGAAMLCSAACQYAGAGYTQVFTARRNVKAVRAFRPSLVVAPISQLDAAKALPENNPGAFVVGSGFNPEDAEGPQLVKRVLKQVMAPVLVDGGALAFLSDPKVRKALIRRSEQGYATVLTPHMGEAMRLGKPFNIEVQSMPQTEAARVLSRCYGSTVVLKGPNTVVQSGEQSQIITLGTAALAKAGTGDVLAGVIGGFLAQGMPQFDAARLGVAVHAVAGVVASEHQGMVSVIPEDVLQALPVAIQRIQAARA